MVDYYFVVGLLTGGVILLIAVILLCVFVRRLQKKVTNLPSSVYDEAFHNVQGSKVDQSKKRKKNVYHRSPMANRPPSTLRRSYSSETITFVPSATEDAQLTEKSKEKQDSAPSTSETVFVELKSFQQNSTPLETESSLNAGCANEAFVPDTNNVQQQPKQLHALNEKSKNMNTPCQKQPNSTAASISRQQHTHRERSNLSNSKDIQDHRHSGPNLSKSFTNYLDCRSSLSEKCQPSNSNDAYYPKNVEQQSIHLKQETKIMAEFDKTVHDCSDSENLDDNEKETDGPVYVNVGIYALKNNPEIHLLTNENKAEHAMNYDEPSSESQELSVGENDNYEQQCKNCENKENREWRGNVQHGYHDYSEQNEYQNFSGQNEYQDYTEQNEYQDLSGQNQYIDFSVQNDFEQFSGQDGYQNFSGQDGYQDFSGQDGYQDFSGQGGYQDSNGQNMYQDLNWQSEYQNFDSQNWYYNNAIEGNNHEIHEQSNYYDAAVLSEGNEEKGHFNEGYQEHVETEPVYEAPLEGEEEGIKRPVQ